MNLSFLMESILKIKKIKINKKIKLKIWNVNMENCSNKEFESKQKMFKENGWRLKKEKGKDATL